MGRNKDILNEIVNMGIEQNKVELENIANDNSKET